MQKRIQWFPTTVHTKNWDNWNNELERIFISTKKFKNWVTFREFFPLLQALELFAN
jgi:hypothetical protein